MSIENSIDPVKFAADLIKHPSVTPRDEGALDRLEKKLSSLGFRCRRYPFGLGEDRVDNLYARLGDKALSPRRAYKLSTLSSPKPNG